MFGLFCFWEQEEKRLKRKESLMWWTLLLFLAVIAGIGLHGTTAGAATGQTIYNSPYVTFSPDGEAFTTNAGDRDHTWYEEDTCVMTGIASSIRALQTGEHYYKAERTGDIPVGNWKVGHRPATCIHDGYPGDGIYHGVTYGTSKCGGYYYSGWIPYCADCGDEIVHMYFYMSRSAAETIDYIPMETDYYYLCPHCTNLEQGAGIGEHQCNAISYNRYKVHYDANCSGNYGGYMEDSFHMYNNAEVYEGKPVTPATHLSRNSYFRLGYEFVGWNTRPDGSGTGYGDEEEILNLTAENRTWDDRGNMEGIVTLYAQWRPSRCTLQIDPAGGSYQGSTETVSITRNYRDRYILETEMITVPIGYTISFDPNGGQPIDSINGTQHFLEWARQHPFEGDLYNDIYVFFAPDGNTDTIRAVYAPDPVTLPMAEREGYSFGGWYYDGDFRQPAGGPGDSILPGGDTTLYAQWVDLKLQSEDNYRANGGKGAVDLSWSQADHQDKAYQVYQSLDGQGWVKINDVDDISNTVSVDRHFAFTGGKETWTVPYTGIYDLSAGGAQGGSYGSRQGGLGGSVYGRFWLQKGEVLTVTAGGKNGYNGGGTATMYGNGGGCTVISSSRKGDLLIAGGGGGASVQGDGLAGGSSAGVLATGIQGQKGGAGGGGGYRGGSAGEYVVHKHAASCYHDESLAYNVMQSTWYANYTKVRPDKQEPYWRAHYLGFNDFYTIVTSPNSVGGHSSGDAPALRISMGRYFDGTVSYIPTGGNNKFRFSLHQDNWGKADLDRGGHIRVYDQKGSLLFNIDPKTTYSDYVRGDIGGGSSKSDRYYDYTVDLPAGTTGVWFDCSFPFGRGGGGGCWATVTLNSMTMTGGKITSLICGYTEGQVLSAKPAYGGSSHVNTGESLYHESSPGVRTGNGDASLQSVSIGFQERLQLEGVAAPDREAPEKIGEGDITKEDMGDSRVRLSWSEPRDRGTEYYHKVASYLKGSENALCQSNITRNCLVSGISGYYCLLDTSAGTVVGASNGTFQREREHTVPAGLQTVYLHVAPVDVAGNVGETTHIQVEKDVLWKLHTKQLEIEYEGAGNIYPAQQDKAYYVRSDGVTPLTLSYRACMDGTATEAFQINHMIFQSRVDGTVSRNLFFLPSGPIEDGEVEIPAGRVSYTAEGAPLLSRYAYTDIRRKDRSRSLEAVQQFLLSKDASGKSILLMPVAGADHPEGTAYSDPAEDSAHAITLIGDGEAPVISGLEILEDQELIDRRDGPVTLHVTAADEGSGVRELYLKVENTDNTVEKMYPAQEDGSIHITVTEDEPIFSGDFTVTVCATDNVGNERTVEYRVTEFALETRISRILEPHDPIFQCGESGILSITTWGYADRVEVEFPEEMTALHPELDTVYTYTLTPMYKQEEELCFMIPLDTPANSQYTVTVRAYKGERRLEDHPSFSAVEVNGSILDELRTRLR